MAEGSIVRASLILLLAGGLVLLSHLVMRPEGLRPRPAPTNTAPPVVLGAFENSARSAGRIEEDSARAAARVPTSATDTARRFITAFTAWEVGRATAADVAALRRSASVRLWRMLEANRGQPAANHRISTARLRTLVIGAGAREGQAATLVANLARGGTTSGIALVVRRTRAGWRVTSLGS